MKGWSVNYPLAILQSQNSDVVMMLNESIACNVPELFLLLQDVIARSLQESAEDR